MPASFQVSEKAAFEGLKICVTGLSRDERRQVKETTEGLGGTYSGNLTADCTHLIVQRFSGAKFHHALKHGVRRGLHVVTLRWFLDSAALQGRLDEGQYGATGLLRHQEEAHRATLQRVASSDDEEMDDERLGSAEEQLALTLYRPDRSEAASQTDAADLDYDKEAAPLLPHGKESLFEGHQFFLDPDVSGSLSEQVGKAVLEGGSSCTEELFAGGNATHVVCEMQSVHKYAGRNLNIVTPLWVLRSIEQGSLQRVIQVSADIGRQLAYLQGETPASHMLQAVGGYPMTRTGGAAVPLALLPADGSGASEQCEEAELKRRQEKVREAKLGVRQRRGPGKQPCRTLPRMPTPASLLDSLCWAISDTPMHARAFCDGPEAALNESYTPAKSAIAREALKDTNFGTGIAPKAKEALKLEHLRDSCPTRALTDSERTEVVYKGAFLTILFPVDRFDEIGPQSKSFFSQSGFTRSHLLEVIYNFYQAHLTNEEVEAALHTDSKHADRLRAMYCAGLPVMNKHELMTRVDFIGSRRSFEGLKRVSRDNSGQVYELFLGS